MFVFNFLLFAFVLLISSSETVFGYSCIQGKDKDWRLCDPGQPDDVCKCHNIIINKRGNSDCKSRYGGVPWCYVVGEYSSCSDKQLSDHNSEFTNERGWNKTIYFSEEACNKSPETLDEDELGNEEFLPGHELDGRELSPLFGGGGIEAPSPEACQTECNVRSIHCDGWTFIEGQSPSCFLKSDVCCNQFGQRKENSAAISGFNCIKKSDLERFSAFCWSTNEQFCPTCPRISVQAFAGGQMGQDLSATAGIGILTNPTEYKRIIFKFIRGKWRRS